MSNWLGCLDDRRPVAAVFGEEAPSLDGVMVQRLSADYDAGCVEIVFDLAEYPENPPGDWVDQGFNVVRVELAVHGAIGLSVHGWPDVLPADISIDRDAGLVWISVAGPDSTGAVTGSMVRVRSISRYHDEALDLPSGKFRSLRRPSSEARDA